MTPATLKSQANKSRKRLAGREQSFEHELNRRYKALFAVLSALLAALLRQAKKESPSEVRRRFESFKKQLAKELEAFTNWARLESSRAADRAAREAIAQAAKLLEIEPEMPEISQRQLDKTIAEKHQKFEAKTTDNLVSFVLAAAALSVGANVVLQRFRRRFFDSENTPLYANALKSVYRTETFAAKREAERKVYFENDVRLWEWFAEPDACPFCKERDGKVYPTSETFDTHPNCRCSLLPVLE